MKIYFLLILFFFIFSCEFIENKMGSSSEYDRAHYDSLFKTEIPIDTSKSISYSNEDYVQDDFYPENDVDGDFVISFSDKDLYKEPILVLDKLGRVKLKIKFKEVLPDFTEIYTFYNGKNYLKNDTTNPLNTFVCILNPEFFNLYMIGVEEDKDLYKVKLSVNDYGYIAKGDNKLDVISIDSFARREMIGYQGFDYERHKNPIHKNPNDQSDIIEFTPSKNYKYSSPEYIEMKGEWIKIKENETIGWIRWKKGKKMLVRFY